MIVIPYVENVSEAVARIMRKQSIYLWKRNHTKL